MFCLDSLLELRFKIEASVGGGRGLFFIVEHTAICRSQASRYWWKIHYTYFKKTFSGNVGMEQDHRVYQ